MPPRESQSGWQFPLGTLGPFLRTQRQLANLSLRELGALSQLSNAYLSQIERGLHEPSVRVLKAIATALDLPVDEILAQAGLVERPDERAGTAAPSTESAIRSDPSLTASEKEALLAVYRSYVAGKRPDPTRPSRT